MTCWGATLENQDTFSGPQGVRIIQVPLYTTIGPQGSYVCTRTDKLSQSNTPWASKQTSDYRGCQIIQCFLEKLNIVIDRPSEYGQIWKNVGLLRCRITGGPLHRHVWSKLAAGHTHHPHTYALRQKNINFYIHYTKQIIDK